MRLNKHAKAGKRLAVPDRLAAILVNEELHIREAIEAINKPWFCEQHMTELMVHGDIVRQMAPGSVHSEAVSIMRTIYAADQRNQSGAGLFLTIEERQRIIDAASTTIPWLVCQRVINRK